MAKGDYLTAILRSPKTIFTSKDIALLWGEQSSNSASVRLNYYVKQGDLYKIRRGIYAKDRNYNKTELATRIFTPSYVSFETILAQVGVTFQFYSQIFVASYLTRDVTIDGQVYSFKQMSPQLLTNPAGIEHKKESSTAIKERALLDTLYINTDYYFDNLGGIDWDKVHEIVPIYKNKRLMKKVQQLEKQMTSNK